MSFGTTGLGSLTQSARQKELKSARGILLAVGILTVIGNLIFVAMAESQVKEAFDKEVQDGHQKGLVFDQRKLAELEESAVTLARLINGGAAALGVLFIVFGLIVDKYPVPITITSLVLYVGAVAVFALLNPLSLLQGIILKLFIIAALAKSIQSALAYEREKASDPAPESPQFG